MNKAIEKQASTVSQATPEGVDLGRWLGRREAFGLIAGRCSAASVESLRQIRDRKLYRGITRTWDEFCSLHVGASRRNVERSIRYLEEFGPEFFHVAQIAHIGPVEYRAIAEHVSTEGIRLDGAVVALLPENSKEVTAAVSELLRRIPSKPAAPEPARFDAVLKSCETAARLLDGFKGAWNRGKSSSWPRSSAGCANRRRCGVCRSLACRSV